MPDLKQVVLAHTAEHDTLGLPLHYTHVRVVGTPSLDQFVASLRVAFADWSADVGYQEAMEVLGWDRGMVLRLFALGAFLRAWDVMTPEKAGLSGSAARTNADKGFIRALGYGR